MGITIAYRGRLADPTRIEDFEDRLVDLALEVGGLAQIWRSHGETVPPRVIRGVILNLAPGQETTSLLVSPEGWLIGLVDIEQTERGELNEPPWCFVKTQCGPLEGHVALIEVLAALRCEFLPDLEVSDEGGYWETRDLAELRCRHSFLQESIADLAEGLERHGLSREAAEDPDIVVRHIERITAQVQRILHRPAEHPPVIFPEDEGIDANQDAEAEEALADEMFKHNRRQQERMQRTFEEAQARGLDPEEALESAFQDEGLEDPDEESWLKDELEWEAGESSAGAFDLPDTAGWEDDDSEDDSWKAEEDRHPLLGRAMELLKELHMTFRDTDRQFEASLRTLFQGAGDAMGGLAQALSGPKEENDRAAYGLRITQLKRALRGSAFARGALLLLRSAVNAEKFQELHGKLGQVERDIFAEIDRLKQ